MATAVYSFGPCNISVNTGASNAWQELGYSREGARIREEAIQLPVPGDENGGPEGVPIEFQHLAEQHYITLELTKFDSAVLQKLRSRFKTGVTAGQTKAPGTLIGTDFFEMLLSSDTVTTNHRRYLKAYVTQPIEEVIGTKFSTPVIVLQALPKRSGSPGAYVYTIWDDTITPTP